MRGEIQLYLPAICLSECRRPIREKFQVRLEADRVRRFLLWAKGERIVDTAVDEIVRRTLQDFLLEKPEMPEGWPPASTLPH
jgi:hypothetical protein